MAVNNALEQLLIRQATINYTCIQIDIETPCKASKHTTV